MRNRLARRTNYLDCTPSSDNGSSRRAEREGEVAELLGYGGRQTPNNKKRNGELLVVSFPNRRGDFFPRCQFEGSHVRAWIPELLKRIPNGWSALAFLTARYEDLDGQSWLGVLLADSARVGELLVAADAYVS